MADPPDPLIIDIDRPPPGMTMCVEYRLSAGMRWRWRIATVLLWLIVWVLGFELEMKEGTPMDGARGGG